MARKEEKWLASLKYVDAHPSDYTNDMYDIVDIKKAFEAGAEWADANPANYKGKAMLHVLSKGVGQGKRETLDKVCEWLLNNVGFYSTNALGAEYMCERLRKEMERDL